MEKAGDPLLRSEMTTGFCLEKPQRPLLILKLVPLPGVRQARRP